MADLERQSHVLIYIYQIPFLVLSVQTAIAFKEVAVIIHDICVA